jgi:hypothetical protein
VYLKYSSFIACKILIPTTIRIRTHGEAPQAIQRVMLTYTALMRTIPTLSVAVAFNWIVMVSIPASVLTKLFSKTASALSQTQKRCESYGIMSLMRTLVKPVKQIILSTGTRPILYYSLDIQTYNHARFYSRVLDLRCKVPCEGKPIMRLRGEVLFLFLLLLLTLTFYFTPRVRLFTDKTTLLGVLVGKRQRKTSTDTWQFLEMSTKIYSLNLWMEMVPYTSPMLYRLQNAP